MSTAVAYDPELFTLERAQAVSARLGEFVLGESTLGADGTAWLDVPMASFAMSGGYTQDDNGTLIIDATAAQVSLSSWTDPGNVLIPGDRVRASYDGKTVFEGTVDATSVNTEVDPDAVAYGSTRRYVFTASAVDRWWIAMQRPVTWTELPAETAYSRVSRFVNVYGWSG